MASQLDAPTKRLKDSVLILRGCIQWCLVHSSIETMKAPVSESMVPGQIVHPK
jgi:hypothetical protein